MSNDNLFNDGEPIVAVQTTKAESEPATQKKPRKRRAPAKKKAQPTQESSDLPVLGIYRMYKDVKLPTMGTEQAACYDVRAYLKMGMTVTVYRADNSKIERSVRTISDEVGLVLDPGERALMPCGLIFDVPKGYSVRSHPRSGLSLKQALTLINGEGVIDSDYILEGFMPLVNHSSVRQFVLHEERCCQIEMVKDLVYTIKDIPSAPKQKTSRTGGFGHSGKI